MEVNPTKPNDIPIFADAPNSGLDLAHKGVTTTW
jgi:hypothetical protein